MVQRRFQSVMVSSRKMSIRNVAFTSVSFTKSEVLLILNYTGHVIFYNFMLLKRDKHLKAYRTKDCINTLPVIIRTASQV